LNQIKKASQRGLDAPPIVDLSNQILEDFKKIYELEPFLRVEDIP